MKEISYEEFQKTELSFEDLTYEKLVELWCLNNFPDLSIAEKCKVPKGSITRLRKNKFNITQYNIPEHIRKVYGIDPSTREEANAIVAFAFRNGFLEDLHAGKHSELLEYESYSRITDAEMKKLMIECCEKMEKLLRMKIESPDRYKLFLSSYGKIYCSDWIKQNGRKKAKSRKWRKNINRKMNGKN